MKSPITPSRKKVILCAFTHGDEPIGMRVIRQIQKNKNLAALYDSTIGNPRAAKLGKRFTEKDLNRSAPGKASSPHYEERRAVELLRLMNQYAHTIDIHQTRANDRVLVILPKLTRRALALAAQLDVRSILIWPMPPKGGMEPLMTHVRSGIGLECGTKSGSRKMIKRVAHLLRRALPRLQQEAIEINKKDLSRKRLYYVYARIQPEDIKGIVYKDFEVIKGRRGDVFRALRFGKHAKLLGYKMRDVDATWALRRLKHKEKRSS